MSSFTVQQVLEVAPFNSQYGQMFAVKMAGLLDGQVTPSATINVKEAGRAPQAGAVLDVMVVETNQWGVKLKKTPLPPPGQASAPLAYQPGMPVTTQPVPPVQAPQTEPEPRQTSIERQSTLAQAIERCAALSAVHVARKDYKAAEEVLAGKHILQVATYFKSYIAGTVNVTMSLEDVAKIMGVEVPKEEPVPEPPQVEREEISIDDIPPF